MYYSIIDIETTGLQYKVDTITTFQIYDTETNTWLSLEDLPTSAHSHKNICISLKPYIQSRLRTHTFIFHNAKFDLRMMEIDPDTVDKMNISDTTILAHYVDPRGSMKLGELEKQYLGTDIKTQYIEKFGKNFSDWHIRDLEAYNRNDVKVTWNLYKKLADKIPENFRSYQEKLLKAIYRMEYFGFPYDNEKAQEVKVEFMKSLDIAIKKMDDYLLSKNINTAINYNSSQQVSKLLYDTLGIEKPNRDRYPAGKAFDKLFTSTMTNQQLLKTINHPFIPMLLDRGSLQSTLTFIKSYSELQVDNRLYPSFNITGTITGRLSCSKPNLQNIKKKSVDKFSPRQLFIPEKGEQLVSIDYQQQEIRMLGILSQDANLLDLVDQGIDMHMAVGIDMLRKDTLTKEERDLFKGLHFGLIYGLSIDALAFQIGLTTDETEALINAYYEKFPGVARWMGNATQEVEFNGRITLFTGRVWDALPHAAYQGINAYVQGSSAEITNMAAIRVTNYLKKRNVGRLMSIIHDEFLLSLRDLDCIPDIIELMEMESLFGHRFLTDVEISSNY